MTGLKRVVNGSVLKKCSLVAIGLAACVTTVLATGSGDQTRGLGTLASNIRGTFADIVKLMLGVAYVAGIGFFIAAIFKFKQHKDNPTQIPMGTPIALLVIAICLVFLPYMIKASGETFTGTDDNTENVAGTDGHSLSVPGLGS